MLDTTNDEGFQRELSRVAEARREHERLLARRKAIVDQLEAAEREETARRATLLKEHEDVVRLESFSLTRVLTNLRGEHDDLLRREHAERETARLALLAVEERQRTALHDLQQVDDRLAALGDVEAEWHRVVDARERWVAATSEAPRPDPVDEASTAVIPIPESMPHADAEALADLIERRGVVEAELRDVDEALAAAHLAASKLAHAASVIGSAQSWSNYGTWFGGGMLASMYDHERLDDAAAVLREVDGVLSVLRRELSDLAGHGVADIHIDGWDRTFDAFLDNFFNDLAVDQRVRAAAEKVSQLRGEIDRIVAAVTIQGQALTAEADDLLVKRNDLVR